MTANRAQNTPVDKEDRPNYSPGGVDLETGVVFEQVTYQARMVYARSDDLSKLDATFTTGDPTSDRNRRITYTVLPEPLPWKLPGEPLEYRDEAYLYNAVKAFCQRYIYFFNPAYYDVLAAWTLASWRIEEWRASGPFYALGPINSGKTTLLEVIEELAYRGIRGGSMSTATMFRLSDAYNPTLLIDESQVYNREEWAETQALLNERYRPGGKVWRMVGEGHSMTPQAFRCWGPTAMASSHAPWEALGSRALLVKMEKGRPEAHSGTAEFYIEASRLRSQLLLYRFYNLNTLLDTTDPDAPPDPIATKLETVQDERTKEVGYPLLKVADPVCHGILIEYLQHLEEEHQAIEETSDSASYVIALANAATVSGKVSVEAVRTELAKLWGLWDDEKAKYTDSKLMPSAKYVSKVLQTLGFKPERMPQSGRAGVVLNHELLERLKVRFRTASLSSLSSHASADGKKPEGNEAGEGGEANRKGKSCEVCGKPDAQTITRIGEVTPHYLCNEHLSSYPGSL